MVAENEALAAQSNNGPTPSRDWSEVAYSVWAFTVLCGMAGIAFRLYGLDRSLWLDEFGTLWVVEANFASLIDRVFSFQGQTPFYYTCVWLAVQLLGESEVVVRLPSMVFGVGFSYVIYQLGEELGGKELGLLSAALAWSSFPLVEADASARPYSLAALFAGLMLLGFARASLRGDGWGRVLFIVGGSGLFASHYVLAPITVWIGVGYFAFPSLRRYCGARKFAFDVSVLGLSVLPWMPHFFAVWGRREVVAWLGEPRYGLIFSLIGPLFVPGMVAFLTVAGKHKRETRDDLTMLFGLIVVAHLVVLGLLAEFGMSFLHRRYAMVIVIPAALLGAQGIRRQRRFALFPLLCWALLTGLAFAACFIATGIFSRMDHEDWRLAVARLDQELESDPQAPVLYRSGFVEEETVMWAPLPAVLKAPLRSPGRESPRWNLVPLTHRWNNTPARGEYFQRVVVPAIRDADRFYLLASSDYSELTGHYPEGVRAWVRQTFPNRFTSVPLEAGSGLLLLRFQRK